MGSKNDFFLFRFHAINKGVLKKTGVIYIAKPVDTSKTATFHGFDTSEANFDTIWQLLDPKVTFRHLRT